MMEEQASEQRVLKPRPPQPPPPPLRKKSIKTVTETCSLSETSPISRRAAEEDFPGYSDAYSHVYDADEVKDPRDSRDSAEETDNDGEEESALDIPQPAVANEVEEEINPCQVEHQSARPSLYTKDYESDGEYDLDDAQPFTPPCPPPSTIPTPNMTTRPSNSNLNEISDGNIAPLQVPRPKKGMIDRQSLGIFKNWKTRYFHLENGRIIYFEPVHWFQEGEYEIVGMKIVVDSTYNDTADVIRLQSFKYPDICLRCKTLESKRRWIHALLAHIKYANDLIVQQKAIEQQYRKRSISLLTSPIVRKGSSAMLTEAEAVAAALPAATLAPAPVPKVCTGWIRKIGQFFPTIRRRFFVLREGMISYYRVEWMPPGSGDASDAEVKEVKPPRALGKFPITHYEIFSDTTSGRIELTLMPGIGSISRRRLVLYLEDYMERDKWVRAINSHAAYIK